MLTKPIKLFVDAHSFDAGFQGTQTFIRELYTELLNDYTGLDIYWGVQNAETIHRIFPSVKPGNILLYKKRRAGILRFVFDIPYYIEKYHFDAAHFQYLAPLKKTDCRYIVTSHDVLFNDFPAYFSFAYRTSRSFLFGKSFKNANLKTTVSAYSKERLSRNYNIQVEYINIIPNGVARPLFNKEQACELIKAKYGIENFILYVSRIEPRKNHALLLEKYIKLQLCKQNIPLVFIGKDSISDQRLQNLIKSLSSEEKAFFYWFPQVEQDDLNDFYAACKLFVYPSKAEGFGIPPLEAAVYEVPVLCSSATAMSKFIFFEPNMFDPNNGTEMEAKLRNILAHPPSEAYLKNVADVVADTYSWKKSAKIFYSLLTEGLKNNLTVVGENETSTMKVAIIARSTLYTVPGGDTVQAVQTAQHLVDIGIHAEIKLSNEPIDYAQYDLLHFFNIIRPADILYHSEKARMPYVVSTILCDYSEYDKYYRKGVGAIFSNFSSDSIEYLKTIARWLLGRDHLSSKAYLWKGQRRSIIEILRKSAMILPNSESEYRRVAQNYTMQLKHLVIPNGVDPQLFQYNPAIQKDDKLVLCVARIEGIKNQLNLIKGLNNSGYKLLIIGSAAPNQMAYYDRCRVTAADNVEFIDHIPQYALVKYYQRAKIHILPSWFETTGLSSIESALMGCNIVITDKGDAKEYFGNDAFYCDPANPESILAAVKEAGKANFNDPLRQKILRNYTWKQAALQTLKAYQAATL